MKTIVNPNTLTDAELLSMILGGRNALHKSKYILQNLSIDWILETQPEELTKLYSLSNAQT
jgi:DNA repair protein RadC